MKKMFGLLMGMMFLASCATAPGKINFLGEYYKKLEPGPEGGAKLRWVKPGVDFNQYKKFMIDYVYFALAPDSEFKGINGDEMKTLADASTKAIIDALKDKYPIVSEPGPDVIRFRFAIVDLKQSRPGLAAATTVIPVGLGISLIKRGATDSWSGSGSTTCQFVVQDSMTNEIIGVAEDEYKAGFTERFTKWGSAEEAFKFWGKKMRQIADNGLDSKK
jgi:hypothetical protein